MSISPFGLSAAEVARGKYDEEYRRFFKIVKESGAKFLFRTMHEMNGSWFSWSGDPYNYKRAWERVYNLSRDSGLSASQLLFIFSANYQDLPSRDGIVGGEMVFCTTLARIESGCKTFEDYYPGDKYVDLMGVTLYNWGRGRSESWAHWTTFAGLLHSPSTDMFTRISGYNKPIFLDEVGTTAVDFKGAWDFDKVIAEYEDDFGRKDYWISSMRQEIKKYPQIVGALYFNRDKTRGFTIGRTIPGELDWAALSNATNKEYLAILRFFTDSDVTLSALPFTGNALKLQEERLFKQLTREIERKSYGNATTRKKLIDRLVVNLTAKAKSLEGDKKNILLNLIAKYKSKLVEAKSVE